MRLSILMPLSLVFIVLILLVSGRIDPAVAQQEEPTAFPPIVVQSNPNLGDVQPISLVDAVERVGALDWINAGYTGTGYKIGVLDRGFGGLLAFEQAFNRAVTLALNDDKTAYDGNPVRHGTQVLEVIQAIAPGAELVVCEYDDLNRYIQCIDWMGRYDVDIINHSAGVPALPLDGRGRWAQQVDRALDSDILWVNSAGNFAQGYYSERLTDRNLNGLHEFGGFAGEVEALGVAGIAGTTEGVVMLSWNRTPEQAANAIDIDLQILDRESGVVIARSYNPQSGQPGQQALEYLRLDMQNDFAVQIIDVDGTAAGVEFSLFVEFANVPGGELLGSIIAPADSGGSLTVGAMQGFEVAPYSSRGPLATGDLGIDMVAPGELTLADGTRFLGTSAAAPIVAGTAALLWQANPALTAQQMRELLLASTVAGGNVNLGQGRLLLDFPVENVPVALAPTLTPTGNAPAPPAQQPESQPTNTPAPIDNPQPTATVASTAVAEAPEFGMSLSNPVTRNADWTPVERDFDGVTMVLVPAGCFDMGSEDGPDDEQPVHEVCFDEPFWIDKYEVTNDQYGSVGCDRSSSEPDQPRNCVDWFEASDYCEARNARLPTEAEWEYAARGPDSLVYPWGNAYDAALVIGRDDPTYGRSSTAPVGSRPGGDSWVGALDMSGNVWEWTSSLYENYPYDEADGREDNDDRSPVRVFRGGAFYDSRSSLRAAFRGDLDLDVGNSSVGFRCVRPPSL